MNPRNSGIVINNEMTEPIGDHIMDYLLSQSKETSFHDFKRAVDIRKSSADFPKIIKDVYAFSNYGGGWLVLGVQEKEDSDQKTKGKFIKVGLPDSFKLDSASLQEKINAYLPEPISIGYGEFIRTVDGTDRLFALIYFPPSSKMLTSKEDVQYRVGAKKKTAVAKDVVYTRRGTQSIPASSYEKELIKKRLENEEYRLSILSGEADEIHEVIYSNLFEVKHVPRKVYLGIARYSSFAETIDALRILHPEKRYFPLRYRNYRDKVVTLVNLTDPTDIHSKIVRSSDIVEESVEDWLTDPDKENIIVSLLNKEVVEHARRQGLRYSKTGRLYYPMRWDEKTRIEKWPTRYKGIQRKQVARKIWNDKLQNYVYVHEAVRTVIMKIGAKFYLRLNPTRIITKDGVHPRVGMTEGAIITGYEYRSYNKQQLNNILFWISKLGNGQDIVNLQDLAISAKPVQTSMDVGIAWDVPVSDLKQFIEEFDAEKDATEDGEENYAH